MIYQRMTLPSFLDLVRQMDRMSNFELDGWTELYCYLNDMTDEGMLEADIVALCCDFQRFEDVAEYNENYGTNHEQPEDVEELACVIDGGPAFITYAH